MHKKKKQCFALIFVIGTAGSTLVLYSFKLKSSSNPTSMELSIVYFAAFDLLVSMFNPFNYIYLESSRWDLVPAICTIIPEVMTVLNPESHFPKKFCIICLIEAPLKVMKNPFNSS